MKQIISCKKVIECKGIFVNAKEALRNSSNVPLDSDFFRPGKYEYSLPNVFKAAVRVKFTRTDGKVVTKKVLITTEYYSSLVEFDNWGMEFYSSSIIKFK